MQYRFYLNDTLIQEEPIGWEAMILRIKRDRELKGVLAALDATLTFRHDGYWFIKDIFDSSGYCDEINVSIHRSIDEGRSFSEIYTGLVRISKMTFEEFPCSVKVVLTDDSFYGRIDKRRTTPAYLTGESTVNGEALTACRVYGMRLFDPSTATYLAMTQDYGAYRVDDVLSYLISYISDNEVEYESPLFGISGEFHNLMLTFGYSIRALGNSQNLTLPEFIEHIPQITFQKLFTELDRRFNIGLYVDNSGSKPKIIIDEWRELFRNNTATSFIDLPNLKTEIASEYIYSRIRLGGNTILDIPAASFPATIRMVGFNLEDYPITGKCPEDKLLDLSYDFISDSNVIEQILILSGTDDSYDKDWFLIDGEFSGGVLRATQSNWLTIGPPSYYNESLQNYEIIKRYLGFIPNEVAAYLGNADNSILANEQTNQDVGAESHLSFSNDSPLPYHDVNNLWTVVPGGADFYTVPLTGIYSVGLRIKYQSHWPIHLRIVAERRDNADTTTLSETTIYEDFFVTADQLQIIVASTLVVASATDLIKIKVYNDGNPSFAGATVFGSADDPAILFIDNTADGGGIYFSSDPADYPIIKHTFTTECKQSQRDDIMTNPMSLIEFYVRDTDIKQGWIDDVAIDEFKGIITAVLLASEGAGAQFPPVIQFILMTGQLSQNQFDLSPSDHYGDPGSGSDTTVKCFFYEVGKTVTVTMPSSHAGCPAHPTIKIAITKFSGSTSSITIENALSASFVIEAGFNYIVQLVYDLTVVGNTFPSVQPYVTPPASAGMNGTAYITCVAPSNPINYTFLWSTGAVTDTINAPPGDYTCLVTNINPGTFTNNSILFHITIPVSVTGE